MAHSRQFEHFTVNHNIASQTVMPELAQRLSAQSSNQLYLGTDWRIMQTREVTLGALAILR